MEDGRDSDDGARTATSRMREARRPLASGHARRRPVGADRWRLGMRVVGRWVRRSSASGRGWVVIWQRCDGVAASWGKRSSDGRCPRLGGGELACWAMYLAWVLSGDLA
jgi:hypothetical protein